MNAENIAITGNGVFDGAGDRWRPVKKDKMTERQWKNLVSSGGKVEDPETPGIQIENATGIIINGKEYKKDSGKMLLSGDQRN